jgi:biotin carboxyl carrier protein
MRFVATIGGVGGAEGRTLVIGLEENGHVRRVTLDGREVTVDWRVVGGGPPEPTSERAAHYSLLIGDRSYDLYVRAVPQSEGGPPGYEVSLGGRTFAVGVQDERAQALASLAGEGHIAGDAVIRAPMPGLVSNILAAEGVAVEHGQAVVVLEAMKMENDLPTPRAGIVKSLRVAKGQTVNQGDVLAVVGDTAGSPSAPPEDEEAGG